MRVSGCEAVLLQRECCGWENARGTGKEKTLLFKMFSNPSVLGSPLWQVKKSDVITVSAFLSVPHAIYKFLEGKSS